MDAVLSLWTSFHDVWGEGLGWGEVGIEPRTFGFDSLQPVQTFLGL